MRAADGAGEAVSWSAWSGVGRGCRRSRHDQRHGQRRWPAPTHGPTGRSQADRPPVRGRPSRSGGARARRESNWLDDRVELGLGSRRRTWRRPGRRARPRSDSGSLVTPKSRATEPVSLHQHRPAPPLRAKKPRTSASRRPGRRRSRSARRRPPCARRRTRQLGVLDLARRAPAGEEVHHAPTCPGGRRCRRRAVERRARDARARPGRGAASACVPVDRLAGGQQGDEQRRARCRRRWRRCGRGGGRRAGLVRRCARSSITRPRPRSSRHRRRRPGDRVRPDSPAARRRPGAAAAARSPVGARAPTPDRCRGAGDRGTRPAAVPKAMMAPPIHSHAMSGCTVTRMVTGAASGDSGAPSRRERTSHGRAAHRRRADRRCRRRELG